MKSLEDLRLDDFRLELKGRSLVPIMQGGMGVNISTAEMAQAVAARGGIGHVSGRDGAGPCGPSFSGRASRA